MKTPPTEPTFRILVTDDLPAIHEDFRKILVPPVTAVGLRETAATLFGSAPVSVPHSRFTLDTALQGEEALRLVRQALAANDPYALAFVDMRMPPGWDGIETIRQFWAADPTLQIVLCTAYSDYSWNQTVRALGDSDNLIILKKPFDNVEVLQLAHALTKKWQVTRLNQERVANLDDSVRQRTAELRQAEERFSRAFDANPLPQAIQDLETGRVIEINAAHEKFSGMTRAQLLSVTPDTFGNGLDPQRWQGLLSALRAGRSIDEWPFTFSPPGRPPREFRCSGRAVTIGGRPCAIWVFRDVTEQTQLEQQFRQAQKMEAVGQLAAGVAHDFNNLLTVILSYTSFALDDPNLPDEHRSGLTQVCAAGQRAAALTRQLLVFSRRQIANPEPLDLGATLTSLREMLTRLLPERIRLEWRCAPRLSRVMADVANLEQIVMNLVVNARDAIPAAGVIRLGLEAVTLTAADTSRHPGARTGNFLCLSVGDDGKGMDEAVLAHIFEPFFTTKDVGQGTGLGLSTVYGIVHQHEGWIEVDSKPNLGTKFSVFLPTLANDAHDHPPELVEQLNQVLPGRGERILLVEDEPFVRDTAYIVASRAGYQIAKAADGPSALQVWAAAAQPFDLLLTDMLMPNGMTGTELALQLRALHPGLKVILSTGYSDELVEQGAKALVGSRLLLKPYDSAELLDTLRSTLDAPPDNAASRSTLAPRPVAS